MYVTASSRYEVVTDGLIVYGVGFGDNGTYECQGTELTTGDTDKKRITVKVVSKLSASNYCVHLYCR